MKLYLLRHAKTDQHSTTGKDFDRSLLPRGKHQSLLMAEHFTNENISPEKILCSTAKRTKETFQYIRDSCREIPVEFLDELYLCDVATYLHYIRKETTVKNLLIIGHNDGISGLASYLTEEYVHLKTCELVVLDFHVDEWAALSAGTATIAHRYRPEAN
jgi:phosphohistidine phosphatase